jgi:hypothetical protein
MVGFCETELKNRLLSPASYKRVEVQTFADPIPIEQYIHDNPWLMSLQIKSLRDGQSKPPIKYSALITYDSANQFGTLIRDKATCELVSSNGEVNHIDESSVSVNGETSLQRSTNTVNAIVRERQGLPTKQ